MEPIDTNNPQANEVAAIVNRESAKIARASDRMLRHLVGLEPVSQKQVLCQAMATWIAAMGDPDDHDSAPAIALSDSMRFQVDLYLQEVYAVRRAPH